MKEILVVYDADLDTQLFECDYCSVQLSNVNLLCRWDTENKRYYVSAYTCEEHFSIYANDVRFNPR